MRTRIKKSKALVNCSEVTGYLVQELGNDGMFRKQHVEQVVEHFLVRHVLDFLFSLLADFLANRGENRFLQIINGVVR